MIVWECLLSKVTIYWQDLQNSEKFHFVSLCFETMGTFPQAKRQGIKATAHHCINPLTTQRKTFYTQPTSIQRLNTTMINNNNWSERGCGGDNQKELLLIFCCKQKQQQRKNLVNLWMIWLILEEAVIKSNRCCLFVADNGNSKGRIWFICEWFIWFWSRQWSKAIAAVYLLQTMATAKGEFGLFVSDLFDFGAGSDQKQSLLFICCRQGQQ